MTPMGAYLWLGGILLLCGLGLPIPEDISLIAAGYFSWKGVLNVHKAFLVCLAAVLGGDTMAFLMGGGSAVASWPARSPAGISRHAGSCGCAPTSASSVARSCS